MRVSRHAARVKTLVPATSVAERGHTRRSCLLRSGVLNLTLNGRRGRCLSRAMMGRHSQSWARCLAPAFDSCQRRMTAQCFRATGELPTTAFRQPSGTQLYAMVQINNWASSFQNILTLGFVLHGSSFPRLREASQRDRHRLSSPGADTAL
jgi:hypothetical protein